MTYIVKLLPATANHTVNTIIIISTVRYVRIKPARSNLSKDLASPSLARRMVVVDDVSLTLSRIRSSDSTDQMELRSDHPNCFVCSISTCSTPLLDHHFVVDRLPYCETHSAGPSSGARQVAENKISASQTSRAKKRQTIITRR